ncbi:MAG: ribosome maturation factor RimM [Halanaerobiales bacterium]|nr:ribosome maturation factor RimM [Halanaerobiales bacterium]
MEDLVTLGKITKNQGNKGELRVAPYTDDLRRFELLESVYLVNPNQGEKTKKIIEDMWYHKSFVILKLQGIDDIGEALKYRNYEVMIKEDELLPLAEDEYYIEDLIDLEVMLLDDSRLGKVINVLDTKGTDILVVKDQKKEYMIPMSKEYIKEIDLENNKIYIDPVNKILDL